MTNTSEAATAPQCPVEHPLCPDEDGRCQRGMDETCPGIARANPPEGFKIVEVIALVRASSADDVHEAFGKYTEYDESLSAYITTRDLTAAEAEDFGEIMEEQEEYA